MCQTKEYDGHNLFDKIRGPLAAKPFFLLPLFTPPVLPLLSSFRVSSFN